MAEWSRVANTTIADYVKGEENNILRNRKFYALLKQKGRLTFNHTGDSIVKRIRFKRAPMLGYADGDTLTFARRDRWKTCTLDWRGYSITDSMTKKEKLMNAGKSQIIDIFSDIGKSLMDDMEDQFGEELYVDGNASGNQKRFHGAESFFGNGGAAAAGYIGSPSDTYAGLSTALGNYGGAWNLSGGNSTWPIGTGDSHYDFFSPLIVDYTDASWAAGTDTWANNAVEALRFGILHSKKNKSKKGVLDYIELDTELYRLFQQANSGLQQININRGGGEGLVSLGFGDTINFEGVDVTYEYGLPTGVGYGWNLDQVDLMSLQDSLFKVEGPDYDMATKSHRTSIDCLGNMWWNPRFQLKFQSVT